MRSVLLLIVLTNLVLASQSAYAREARDNHMLEGRRARLPVSAFYETNLRVDQRLELRTICNGADDTGMLVAANGALYYNDDHTLARGNRRGSYLCPTCTDSIPAGSMARVLVFSQGRATSQCTLQKNTGAGWIQVTRRHFGGTLVETGPLHQGDFLEVQTHRLEGAGIRYADYDTHMVLFDKDEPYNDYLYSDENRGDMDPRIVVPDDNWLGGKNYVLVGKKTQNIWRNKGREVNVDLLRGPLNADYRSTPLDQGRLLKPGRYYLYAYAKTTSPIGHTSPRRHNASAMKPHSGLFTCPDSRQGMYRGTLNGPAFHLLTQRNVGGTWQTIRQREVRKANMGSGSGYNLFIQELAITEPTQVRMVVRDKVADVTMFSSWRVMRNPDASEFTVASFNTLYDDGVPHLNKTRNAAHLLANRGKINRFTGEIEEAPDQVPWQWDADIIALQELRDGKDDDKSEYYYAHEFANEATRWGSRSWAYILGQDEDYAEFLSWGIDGRGPVFVSEQLWPSSYAPAIRFSRSALENAGCNTYSNRGEYECPLDGGTHHAIPARISVTRRGTVLASGAKQSDRPITVVNVHLESDSGDHIARQLELNELMDILKSLLRDNPQAFNNSVSSAPDHYQNRIILMADFNWSAHHCGEHYVFLRRLREVFGYAIDASMAAGDYDMHDYLGTVTGSAGVPRNFANRDQWQNRQGNYNDFPYWMSTYRGKTGGNRGRSDRYDAILLVGRGWAYDDPIRDYQVMSDQEGYDPMNATLPGGVEM